MLIICKKQQVNISLVVHDREAKQCVRALHSAFFETEVETDPQNGVAAVRPTTVNGCGGEHVL